MKRTLVLMAISAGCLYAQSLDFSSLDRLESKAKEVNRVSLDGSQLRAAMQLAPQDEKNDEGVGQAKKLLSDVQGVMVRNYTFEKTGQYQDSDLDPIRRQLEKLKGWSKIVDSKEKNEHSEVFMFSKDEKTMGIAVIDAEPKELSVVVVNGALNLGDLGKLHGLMGLPSIRLDSEPKKETK